jgi:uncharacterized protein YukE
MSSIIRVNPESVRQYARQAQSNFETIRAELDRLVKSVAEVRYLGENAFVFKTGISELSVEFANKFSHDLAAIADHIRVLTSNIAGSLGGQPITIEVKGGTITAPAIQKSDVVDVDTTELAALTGVVTRHFGVLTDNLDQHLRALEATDWVGQAKDSVSQDVRQYTQKLRNNCDEVSGQITKSINDQVAAARQADRG